MSTIKNLFCFLQEISKPETLPLPIAVPVRQKHFWLSEILRSEKLPPAPHRPKRDVSFGIREIFKIEKLPAPARKAQALSSGTGKFEPGSDAQTPELKLNEKSNGFFKNIFSFEKLPQNIL